MKVIEAPERFDRYTHDPVLFLGGGITNCPDWQKEVLGCLEQVDNLIVLNPRRAKFDLLNPTEQIEWEFDHLIRATGVFFWFPKESLCPITLFEYGKWLVRDKKLFVGVHPDYERKIDVVEQTRLEKPTMNVATTLQQLISEVIQWSRER